MSRYAAAHANLQGPGDARPTALQIVSDEGLTGKLTDKVFLVTGVSSGIGIETLRALYATGAHVIGTCRNLDKAKKVVEEIERTTQSDGKISLVVIDQESFESVRKGAEEIKKLTDKLNVAVFNAGVMATPYSLTKDGNELQFQTNHLSHFLLFQLLLPELLQGTPSRVVSVSSIGHRTASTRPEDYTFSTPSSYSPWTSYGQAKTANIHLANAITRHYGSRGLHALSLHPGGIDTGLQVHVDEGMKAKWAEDESVRNYMKSPAQGAATSVYAALGAVWEGVGGVYMADCAVQGPRKAGGEALGVGDEGHAEWAFDEEAEERLWKDSLALVGLKGDVKV
ncbi:hypothetical protein Q7P37_003203 [Cladosporium fusiforme]